MDESSVIERIKSGDKTTLDEIYKQYRAEFISWVVKQYSCSTDEAKDVYQSAVLILYENIINGKLTELTSSVKTYLYSVGKNKMREARKITSRYKFEITEGLFAHNISSDTTEDELTEQFNTIAASLKTLGDPCSTVLQLFYYEKQSMEQIADKQGYKNKDTAKNLKHKCLKRLRKIYHEELTKHA